MRLQIELSSIFFISIHMQHISLSTIKTWERFYRANFINCLTGFKPVSLIATSHQNGQPNLGVFSSIVHLGSDPALVGYINRPISAAPHTLANIQETGVYTINHIHPGIVEQAHQCSAKYAADENEFSITGLTPVYKENILAPFVKESFIQFALKLVEVVPIQHNNTFLVIGAVTDVFIESGILQEDGFLALEHKHTLASLGADGYYSLERFARFSYAKPGKVIEKID